MTLVAFERALRGFCKRRPFRRYKVELVSGEKFVVSHPEALILRSDSAVFVGKNGAYRVFDHETVCEFYE
jgi:hypothetical protein